MAMNKGLQAHIIEQKFKNSGVSDFDVKAQIDKQLTLPENIENLREQGYLPRKTNVNDRIVENQIHQALEALEDMGISEKQAEVDGAVTAEETFEPPLTEKEFGLWLKNPEKYDIKGVDTAKDALQVELGFEY